MNRFDKAVQQSNIIYKSVFDEIVTSEFDFVEYWKECEANIGKVLTLTEVKRELIRDIS